MYGLSRSPSHVSSMLASDGTGHADRRPSSASLSFAKGESTPKPCCSEMTYVMAAENMPSASKTWTTATTTNDPAIAAIWRLQPLPIAADQGHRFMGRGWCGAAGAQPPSVQRRGLPVAFSQTCEVRRPVNQNATVASIRRSLDRFSACWMAGSRRAPALAARRATAPRPGLQSPEPARDRRRARPASGRQTTVD